MCLAATTPMIVFALVSVVILTQRSQAQTLTVLYSFTGGADGFRTLHWSESGECPRPLPKRGRQIKRSGFAPLCNFVSFVVNEFRALPENPLDFIFSLGYYTMTYLIYMRTGKSVQICPGSAVGICPSLAVGICPSLAVGSANSLFRNILRISPYSSKILMVVSP